MATTKWSAGADMNRASEKKAGQLNDFFDLVRRIERAALFQSDEDSNHLSSLGGDGLPSNESLRFKINNHLAFPGNPVEKLKNRLNDETASLKKPSDVVVNFMGLTGPSGVLPQHYTRLVMERLKQKDKVLADFLDLFNHRLISLFYRSWVKYRFSTQYESYLLNKRKDPFTRVLQSLSGQHSSQKYDAPIYYGGHFSKTTRSVSALTSILSDFLNLPVKIQTFVGQWLQLNVDDRAMIGSRYRGRNNCLGHGVLLGKFCWDRQSKINVEVGPIDYQSYEQLTPGKKKFEAFKKLINSYVPTHLTIDLLVTVSDPKNIHRKLSDGMRLSQSVWLRGQKKTLIAKQKLHRS
jgi:type VI secretion system protein ImpH